MDGSEVNMYNNKKSKTNLGQKVLEGPMGTGTLHLGARFNASNCDSFIKRQPSKCDKGHRITPIMYVLCHITQNF